MNQAIQINDGFVFDPQKQAMCIEAQMAGNLILCFIGDVEPQNAGAFYNQWQFDIEDRLTELLERETWNEQGEVWLSALQFD